MLSILCSECRHSQNVIYHQSPPKSVLQKLYSVIGAPAPNSKEMSE